MGFHRVREGERVAVWSLGGEVRYVDGPYLLFTLTRTVVPLPYHYAGPNEYLRVEYVDGRVEHLPGPTSIFEDGGVTIKHIHKRSAISLTSHEVLVVYRRRYEGPTVPVGHAPQNQPSKSGRLISVPEEEGGVGNIPRSEDVERTIICGPSLHVPASDEWIHEFSWHGSKSNSGGEKCHIVPNARVFEKLKVVADHVYYNITDVRTADDALLHVKVMIFYEFLDIEKMLDATNDPIGDIVNGTCSDVVAFGSRHTYEEFVDSTPKLNELAEYPNLLHRAEMVGIKISKVVYRGYHAMENLQKMHNDAIQRRTKLRLEAETEEQQQQILDMKLEREKARLEEASRMEEEKIRHKNHLSEIQHAERIRQMNEETEARIHAMARENEERGRVFKQLHDLGVDMTQYMTAQYEKPAKIIRVDGTAITQSGNESPNPMQFHLHEQLEES